MASRFPSNEVWCSLIDQLTLEIYLKVREERRYELWKLIDQKSRGHRIKKEAMDELANQLKEIKYKLDNAEKIRYRLIEDKNEFYKKVYKLSNRIFEEIKSRIPSKGHYFGQDPSKVPHHFELFSKRIDPVSKTIVRYIVGYCLEFHGYVCMVGERQNYMDSNIYYGKLTSLVDAVLIAGHRYRATFREIIMRENPVRRGTGEKFTKCIITSLFEVFHFSYSEEMYVTYLILTAFVMEVIYYINECAINPIRRNSLTILAMNILCSLFSCKDFNMCGGLKIFVWFADSLFQGQRLVAPSDYLGELLWRGRVPLEMHWRDLERDFPPSRRLLPKTPTRSERFERLPPRTRDMTSSLMHLSLDTRDLPTSSTGRLSVGPRDLATSSTERLAGLPLGTSASNIKDALASSKTSLDSYWC